MHAGYTACNDGGVRLQRRRAGAVTQYSVVQWLLEARRAYQMALSTTWPNTITWIDPFFILV